MSRLSGMVEFVTDIVMSAVGVATSEANDEDKLESLVGWHFGFYSRPKDGARGVVLKADGQGNTSFLIAWRDKQYELTLEKGEVGIKSAFDATILLDEAGDILLTSKSGQLVKLNGDDYSLLKTDDFLNAFSEFLTALKADLTAGASGGCTTTGPDSMLPFVAATYKSTKVKNG